jgi:hypothetical protein
MKKNYDRAPDRHCCGCCDDLGRRRGVAVLFGVRVTAWRAPEHRSLPIWKPALLTLKPQSLTTCSIIPENSFQG